MLSSNRKTSILEGFKIKKRSLPEKYRAFEEAVEKAEKAGILKK